MNNSSCALSGLIHTQFLCYSKYQVYGYLSTMRFEKNFFFIVTYVRLSLQFIVKVVRKHVGNQSFSFFYCLKVLFLNTNYQSYSEFEHS